MQASPWMERVRSLHSACRFEAGASAADLEDLESWLGFPLPVELRMLLAETNGISGASDEGIIWPASEIRERNQELREDPEFHKAYMPLDHLLFFGEDAEECLFGYAIHADGKLYKGDVYQWNEQSDAREWYAEGLGEFLKKYLSGEEDEDADDSPDGELKLVRVESSMLSAVGYDARTRELEAVFHSGDVWRYTGVPRRIFKELLASGSKGQYMRDNVIHVYRDYRVSRRRRR